MNETQEVKAFKEVALKFNEKNIEMMSLLLEWDSMPDEEREEVYEKLEKHCDEMDELEIEMDKKYAAVEALGKD